MVQKAKKKKSKKAKNKGGRPTKYKPEYVQIAGEVCKDKGYTDKNLAQHFKVSERTINQWKRVFPQFLQSLKKGKDEFDSRVVEQSLLKRATGYAYDETTREPVIVSKGKVDENDIQEPETVEEAVERSLVVTKVVRKEVAASDVAIIFWLKNRRPQRWSDVKEVEHRIEGGVEPLTVEEMKKRIVEADDAGTAIDERSIEGGNGNSS